jgi:hypothetical protein
MAKLWFCSAGALGLAAVLSSAASGDLAAQDKQQPQKAHVVLKKSLDEQGIVGPKRQPQGSGSPSGPKNIYRPKIPLDRIRGEKGLGPRTPFEHRYIGTQKPTVRNWVDRAELVRRYSQYGHGAPLPLGEPQVTCLTSFDLDVPDPDMTSDDIQPKWAKTGLAVAFATNATGTKTGLLTDKQTLVTYLYGNNGEYYHIWTMDREGKNLTQVTSGSGDERFPEISAGGNKIAYAARSGPGASYKIFVKDLITGTVTQVTFGAGDDIEPTWSPAGDRVAFARSVGGADYKIWSIRIDGSDPRELTSSADQEPGNDRHPSWSPDGLRILFERDGRLWMMTDMGLNQTQWTVFEASGVPSVDIEPFWLPAKPEVGMPEAIFFASTRMDTDDDAHADFVGTTYDCYRMWSSSAEGGANNPFSIVTNPAEDRHPTASVQRTTGPGGGVFTWYTIFQSNRLGPDGGAHGWDLYVTIPNVDEEDYDPPTLDAIPTVTPRLQAPGSDVTIRAKLSDNLTGVDRVWAQFKDPDDEFQDAAGEDHKVYIEWPAYTPYTPGVINDAGSNAYITLWTEAGCQAIDPFNFSYDFPFVLDYWLSVIDPTQPPPHSLELYDDGPISLGGHEPEGETAGDGYYTNTWTTPSSAPSDYYLDIICRDKNYNMMVYDDIYGFSTLNYAKRSILVVQDYGAGQWFISPRTSQDFFQYVPAESWMTHNPTGFAIDPDQTYPVYYNNQGAVQGALVTNSPLGNFQVTGIGNLFPVIPYRSYEGWYITPDSGLPYDIWRTQCRDPIAPADLAYYLPFPFEEPDPSNPQQTRSKLVAERLIFWFSPYAGDLWVTNGSIIDPAVQQTIQWYITQGGRIVLSGQDVAWALTLDGSTANTMLSSSFGVDYVDDWAGDHWTVNVSTATNTLFPSQHPIGIGALDPIYSPPHWDWYLDWPDEVMDLGAVDPPSSFRLGSYFFLPAFFGFTLVNADSATGWRTDCCMNQAWPDGIRATGSGIEEFVYTTQGGDSAGVVTYDSGTGSKTFFAGFGIEGIFNQYHTATDNLGMSYLVSNRRRMQVMQAAAAWMRQGRISGKLTYFDNEAQKFVPLEGALVKAYENYYVQTSANRVLGTDLSEADGSYEIVGLDSFGYYVAAYKPGYTAQHHMWMFVEGPLTTYYDMVLTKTEPGWIEGRVTDSNGNGVIGAEVTAQERIFGVLHYSDVTDNEGYYRIENVETGEYIVKVTGFPSGYESSVPPSYGDPNDPASGEPVPLVVTANQGVPDIDFVLQGAGGTVSGRVTNAETSAAVYPGTVEVFSGSKVVGSAELNENGEYETGEIPAGTYLVRCTAPGYQTQSKSGIEIPAGGNATVDFAMEPLPPGSLSGLITISGTGAAIGAGEATVRLKVGSATVVGPIQTIDPVTEGGYTYNYKFETVPAGTYTVEVTAQDYSVDPKTGVVVTSGAETRSVNFVLKPLHVFGAGLTLISTPFDYESFLSQSSPLDAAGLLQLQPGELRMATWETDHYTMYPQGPAETFLLGRGYFMYLDQAASLLKQGDPAAEGVPYDLQLYAGWNLIGTPFVTSIDWLQVMVQVGAQAPMTMQEAIDSDIIKAGLWKYPGFGAQYQLATSLDAWYGYWVKATQSCKLIIDATRGLDRSSEPEHPARSRRVPGSADGDDGWRLSLVASGAGLVDSNNLIGVSSQALDGHDRSLDIEEPPQVSGAAYLQLAFPHDDWQGDSGRYAHDIRSAGAQENVWHFVVGTNLENVDVKLTWPEIAKVPRGTTLVLVDEQAAKRVFMRSASSYTFSASSERGLRSFRIETSRTNEGALMVCAMACVPVRAQSVGSISFALTKDATVDVTVLSLTGKPIRSLGRGIAVTSGSGQVVWDGRDAGGSLVPGGVYIVEVRAHTAEGEQARAVQNIVVSR